MVKVRDKSQLRMRYLILFLTCMLMVGNYFCFDNPAALKTQLQTKFHRIPKETFELDFNLLYTIYSIPNIFLPFFGGILVDRFGVRTMLILFSFIILLGQIVFAIGCSLDSFTLMLIGRLIFGLGGESLGVAQSTLVVAWFKARELAFALGINLSVARLGSVINNEVSPIIADKSNVAYSLWFGVAVCVISFLCTLAVVPIDQRADQLVAAKAQATSSNRRKSICTDVREFRPMFWMLAGSCLVVYGCVLPFNNVASSLLMERDYFKTPPKECQRCFIGAYENMTDCSAIAPGCPLVPPYSWPLPKLSANCTIKHPMDQFKCSKVPPYIASEDIDCDENAWKNGPLTQVYCLKKSRAEKAAATPMSVPYIMSAILSPFLGFLVDKIGKRAVLAVAAPIALTCVHLTLGLTHMSVWGPLVLQGIAYSVFAAALWPSVPYLVESHQVGIAYGMITAIQNGGLALFPMLVAAVYDIQDSYIPNVELLFCGFGILGIIFGVIINILDYRSGSILNRPGQSPEFDQAKELLLNGQDDAVK